jgi:hypothetical protein
MSEALLDGKNPLKIERPIRYGDGPNVETLGTARTLTTKSRQFQCINATSAFNLTLPAEEGNEGLWFEIYNASSNNSTITVKNDAASTIVSIAQGGSAKVMCDGTNWKKIIDVGLNTGASLLASDNAWTGTNDFSKTVTGTDELVNADLGINHATQVGVAVDATVVQTTTARTGGYAATFRSSTTSLAGDLNSVPYYDYYALTPTDGGGSAVHVAFAVGSGHDRALDLSACATGEGVIAVGDNLAIAAAIKEGSNSYLVVTTTDGGEKVTIGQRLALTAPMSSPCANSQSIDNSATISLPTGGINQLVATSSAANKTGVILTAGSYDGQQVVLINTSSNSITFAASGTSHVADGTSAVLAALSSMRLVYSNTASLWFHGN